MATAVLNPTGSRSSRRNAIIAFAVVLLIAAAAVVVIMTRKGVSGSLIAPDGPAAETRPTDAGNPPSSVPRVPGDPNTSSGDNTNK